LWRALHVKVDSPPHVFEDAVGLKLAAPEAGWQDRPDMSSFTKRQPGPQQWKRQRQGDLGLGTPLRTNSEEMLVGTT
jgi:hypothetical protein